MVPHIIVHTSETSVVRIQAPSEVLWLHLHCDTIRIGVRLPLNSHVFDHNWVLDFGHWILSGRLASAVGSLSSY